MYEVMLRPIIIYDANTKDLSSFLTKYNIPNEKDKRK